MDWPDIAVLPGLLAHLCAYGELYSAEVEQAGRHWLPLLSEADWIAPLAGDAFAVTDAYLALRDDLTDVERQRRVCFAIPDYRRYLIGILAQGLVQAGQLGDYHTKLERWVAHDLAWLAPEINALLDELEAGQGRMVEWDAKDVQARFAKWLARYGVSAEWDRVLLGLSASPEQLFSAVLSHARAFALPRPARAGEKPVALLPDFELAHDADEHLPMPAPWTTVRLSVHSSLPFFGAQGDPLYETAQPVHVIWQDMLAVQPYYRAVLRVVIAVRLSGYGMDALTLSVPEGLGSACVLIGNRERGRLADLLPHLVEVLGYRALSRPSPAQVGRILEHWAVVGALEVESSQVSLREQYACTLYERRRALMLLRGPAWEEQVRLERYLKETR